MSKRFFDTEKYKKRFYRNLPIQYKVLWDFLLCECDCAGIWYVDEEVAQVYLGKDCKVDFSKALELFNRDEPRIYVFDLGKRWLIIPFVEFQYGKLSENNRAHNGVILRLQEFDLLGIIENPQGASKPLTSPLDGAMDIDIDIYKEKDKENNIENEKFGNSEIVENKEEDDVKRLCEMYMETLPELPSVIVKVLLKNKNRYDKVKTRIKDIGGIEECQVLLDNVSKSDFLMGRTSEWRANFTWLFEEKNNWVKVMQGNYNNTQPQARQNPLLIGQVYNDEQSKDILKKSGL